MSRDQEQDQHYFGITFLTPNGKFIYGFTFWSLQLYLESLSNYQLLASENGPSNPTLKNKGYFWHSAESWNRKKKKALIFQKSKHHIGLHKLQAPMMGIFLSLQSWTNHLSLLSQAKETMSFSSRALKSLCQNLKNNGPWPSAKLQISHHYVSNFNEIHWYLSY